MQPGHVVAERFRLECLVHQHGDNILYRARDLASGDLVALKMVEGESRRLISRFEREAELLAELAHPGIVRFVESGEIDGTRYIAMEWLEGETLLARLTKGALDVDETIALSRTVAEALGAGHRAGVVHRDVKPSNVLLVDDDPRRAKLLDFGVARWSARRPLTQDGMLVGTPGYMSPEQARGDPVDARADVFSLGCLLFECIAGLPAFAASSLPAVLMKILFEDPPRLSEVTDGVTPMLDSLVASMLRKEPSARPADGDAVVRALDAIATAPGALSSRPPRLAPRDSLGGEERRLVSLVVVASGGIDAPDLESTAVREGGGTRDDDAMSAAAMRAGGLLVHLVDGTRVCILVGGGDPMDHGARAARCALSLRAHAGEHAIVLGTGLAELETRLPVGRVVDRVEALATQSSPGVMIDHVTRSLLGPAFEVEETDGAFFLTGERAEVDFERTFGGRVMPFVGRERELRMLVSIWDATASDHSASSALVVGGTGLGKTRLCHELVETLRARTGPAEIWRSRGDAIATTSPLSLLADLIRRAAGVSRAEAADDERKALARFLSSLPLDDPKRTGVFLGVVLGIAGDEEQLVELRAARLNPALMGDLVRDAIESLFTARCELGPLLVLVDDVHLGDLPTIHVLDHLLDRLRELPLAVIAFARPQVEETFPSLWASRAVTRISLPAIGRRATSTLARAALGDDAPTDAVELLVERSEGNPFFLEELARSRATEETSTLPPSLVALVQRRLESLDPSLRRVLRAASIFGETAWHGAIAHLLGAEPGEARGEIDALCERELLVPQERSRFVGETEVAFRQALVREAAYLLSTDDDRALGHRLAAEWLVRAGERDPRVLAEHRERAGLAELAAEAWLAAAERAIEAHDLAGALYAVERGRASSPAPAILGSLLGVEADAASWRGDNEQAETAARTAMALLRPGSIRWYQAARWRAGAAIGLADLSNLVEIAGQALQAAPGPDATETRVVSLARIATHLFLMSRPDLAERLLFAIADDANRLRDTDPAVAAPLHEAWARGRLVSGDLEGYANELLRARELSGRAGDQRAAMNATSNIGFAYLELGRNDEAARELDDTIRMAAVRGLDGVAAVARHNLGRALARAGRLDDALEVERRAVMDLERVGSRRIEGCARAYLAEIHLARNEPRDALREATLACARLRELPLLAPLGHACLARARLTLGDVDGALEAALAARAVLETVDRVEEGESAARLVHAEALDAAGRHDEARAAIADARARLHDRARLISDEAWRTTFLEAIPEHARTLELAERWAG